MTTATVGDCVVSYLYVNSPRAGSWNATANFLSCAIVEEIFTPGVTAEIEVIDYLDYIGTWQLGGDETVLISLLRPIDGKVLSYTFLLNNVVEIDNAGALHAKVYKLVCVSLETLRGQGVYVQQAFNTTIDQIVQQLWGSVQSTYSIATETTQGQRNFNIQSEPVFHVIEMLRKEAISSQFPTSNYMFFQNSQGFNFKSMDYMASQGVVKTFQQTNTLGYNILSFPQLDTNLITWKVNQMHDAMSRVKAGVVNQLVSTFNVYTNDFTTKTFSQVAGSSEMGSFVPTTMPTFWALFSDCFRNVIRYVNPNQNLNIGPSNVPDNLMNKMVNLAQWMEQQLYCTVIGDPTLVAGAVINCNVPQVTAQSPPPNGTDVQAAGKWLISKIEHNVRRPDVKPRWVCSLECLKGAFNQ